MTLQDRYRPRTLSEIVGQPQLYKLMALAARPRRSCWCLEGTPGIGKSATADAFADELACSIYSKHPFNACEVNIETAMRLFKQTLRSVPMDGAAFHVVLIEELERCVSKEVVGFLKTALDCDKAPDEGGLPSRCIVIATSNDVRKIPDALLERFSLIHFSSGPPFADACRERLAEIWEAERPGEDLPQDWFLWGWDATLTRFSMRIALRRLVDHLELLELVGAA